MSTVTQIKLNLGEDMDKLFWSLLVNSLGDIWHPILFLINEWKHEITLDE